MRPFGCRVIILNTLDPLGKFDGKAEEGFLVGYSVNSKAFRSSDDKARDCTTDDAAGKEKVQEPVSKYDQALKNVLERMMNQEKEATEHSDDFRKEFQAQCNSQLLQEKKRTNHKDFQNCLFACFLSQNEPTKITQALNDEEPANVEEVVDVVTTAKLITKVVTTARVDNMAGYKMNYFKGLSYDEIIPFFEKHYNYNQAFLNKVNEGVKVLEKEVRKEKEVKVESSKREDVTPLASNIPIIDYKIHTERNRPYFKIIRADGNHRERFEKTEPKNFLDDYLLNTLKIMFEKHNAEANVWRSKRQIWFSKDVLLVEKMYPLTYFTLKQMVNDVRLEVDDESEMSLELLRLVRRQLNEGGGLLGYWSSQVSTA
nr:ribonuclease H-like domain-containing protein [Tanacetum cinerariifolium]